MDGIECRCSWDYGDEDNEELINELLTQEKKRLLEMRNGRCQNGSPLCVSDWSDTLVCHCPPELRCPSREER